MNEQLYARIQLDVPIKKSLPQHESLVKAAIKHLEAGDFQMWVVDEDGEEFEE
jgi:hypothetical protein